MQFTQGLHRAVQQRANGVATICNGRQKTFRELRDRVARLAAGLRGLGAGRGDRICILALNSDRYLEAYLAIAWMGAVAVPANFRWSNAEIIYSTNDSGCSVLIVDDHFSAQAAEIRNATPTIKDVVFAGDGETPSGMTGFEALIANSAPISDVGARGDDLLGIFYTGGTTGTPKGVMLSHRNLGSSGLALLTEGIFSGDARALHVAPMFHLADMLMLACLIIRGAQHVFLSAFRPDVVLETIDRYAITDTLLVPSMIQMIVDHPSIATCKAESLKTILYGASPISETLIDRAMAAFPNTQFMQGYGMTEVAALITILPPAMHTAEGRKHGKLRSAGRATSHVEVRVVDEAGCDVAVGEIGEIIARGPNVMLGYLNKPEATNEAIRDGWMHTGDMAYIDSDGYVFIVDRLKDMIISGGENVYSSEVENAVATHPAVAACAVIGIPCEELGERVHATIVLRAGASLTQDELYAHCKAHIAGYKCPRSIEIVDALPISGAGKILKTKLREKYWHQGRNVN